MLPPPTTATPETHHRKSDRPHFAGNEILEQKNPYYVAARVITW